MDGPLAPLLADGIIEEVIARLKSGKEADLWLVRHAGEVVAAKVYKERQARSFRNNAAYKEGRRVRDSRTQRAMDRGTRFGQAAAEDAWKAKEADALHALHAAGVHVPRPVLFYEGVLLMELVVDAVGRPAPRLVDAHVPRAAAAGLYSDLRAQAVGMLCCDLVHGDLSAYNVLLGRAGPVVIDLPQVVGAAHNSQAEAFFRRDLENVRRFLAAQDPALHGSAGDAREIWRAYERRELTPGFVPTGVTFGGPAHRAQPRPLRAEGQRADGHAPREQNPHRPRAPRSGREVARVERAPALPQPSRAGAQPSHAPALRPHAGSQGPHGAPRAPGTNPGSGQVRRRRRRRRR